MFFPLLTIDISEQLAMGIPQEQIPPVMAAQSPDSVRRGVKRSSPDQLPLPR